VSEAAQRFDLAGGGLRASVSSFGATLLTLLAPDRGGRLADVVLGFESAAEYEASPAHLGGIVGRFANRIAGARFSLDGSVHLLEANEGRHHLHGGSRGFDRRPWRAAPLAGAAGVELRLESAAGEAGYPGRLDCAVRYWIDGPGDASGAGELCISFEARADRPTPVSLTQHAYWNLAGPPGARILDHELEIDADAYLPVDGAHLPSGEIRSVAGTPFDFRSRKALGRDLDLAHPELCLHRGYDHPFVLRGGEGKLRRAARLAEPRSGRVLEIHTTAPCLQLYGGQHLAQAPGKAGWSHGPSRGLCLEAQRFPDAPNQQAFPSAILRPGEVHRQETRYRFFSEGPDPSARSRAWPR
jgi:aldose 1-epimerase